MPDSDSEFVPWLVQLLRQVVRILACNEFYHLTDNEDRGFDEDTYYEEDWYYDPHARPLAAKMVKALTAAARRVKRVPWLNDVDYGYRCSFVEFLLLLRDSVDRGGQFANISADEMYLICRRVEIAEISADQSSIDQLKQDAESEKDQDRTESQTKTAITDDRALSEEGNTAEPLSSDFPNPSAPMTKKDAADAWGGAMTVKKLTELMKNGTVRYKQLSREKWIFCRDDVPNLPER